MVSSLHAFYQIAERSHPLNEGSAQTLQEIQADLHHPDSIFIDATSDQQKDVEELEAVLAQALAGKIPVPMALMHLGEIYQKDFNRKMGLTGQFVAKTSLSPRDQKFYNRLIREESRNHFGYFEYFNSKYVPETAKYFNPNNHKGKKCLLFDFIDVLPIANSYLGLDSSFEAKQMADFSLIYGFLLYCEEQTGWHAIPEARIDLDLRTYAEKFCQRKRPFYLGPRFVPIHGVRAHPFEAMYHDAFHYMQVMKDFYKNTKNLNSEGEQAFQNHVTVTRFAIRALDEIGVADIGTEQESRYTLLSRLAEGHDLHCPAIPWDYQRGKLTRRFAPVMTGLLESHFDHRKMLPHDITANFKMRAERSWNSQ
jgi:hypothetical protein